VANYTFSADLVDDILFRAGEATDGTSEFEAAALQYLNRAYQAIWMGGSEIVPEVREDWWWLRQVEVINLEPFIEAGTVSVTNNSTAITFSSAPAKDLDGWFFRVTDEPDVFRIAAHTAGQAAATLDEAYTGDTAAAKAYKVFKLEYDLPSNLLRLKGPMRQYREPPFKIDLAGVDELDLLAPLARVERGVPRRFAEVDENTVRFDRYVDELTRVEFDFLVRPAALTNSGAEEPVVPLQFRKTLADVGTFLLFLDKNDDRADSAGLLARNGLAAMALENRRRWAQISRNHIGRIFPRQGETDRFSGPVRTESGLIIG
jgi:hypothetical protein